MNTIMPEKTRKERRAAKHRSHRKAFVALLVTCVTVVGAAGVAFALNNADSSGASPAAVRAASTTSSSSSSSTTSTQPTTTTTTLPALAQPPNAVLPAFRGTLGPGSSGEVVRAYQQRLADLHFDPGTIDGHYGVATTYAVQALQKLTGAPRTGRLGVAETLTLTVFQYPQPLQPNGEPNRTEVDVAKQLITLYENYQVRLITTTSTGSGEHYCYNSPRLNPTQHICEVATTPSGRFTYTRFVSGWDKSPLGQLYQPYYFNGGIAVHGYTSVPTGPASHGCTRIPMHIAEYFHTLVHVGDPVYVFGGTPAQILSSSPIGRVAARPPAPVTAAPAPPVAPAPAPTPPPS